MRGERPARGGRGVTPALGLLVILGAVLAFGAAAAWPYLKAQLYQFRIQKGRNPEGNLYALGRLRHPAGEAVLEKYARNPGDWGKRKDARTVLWRYYPRARFCAGEAELSEILRKGYPDGTYVQRYFENAGPLAPRTYGRLTDWLLRHPDHPSRDEVFLRMAVDRARGAPLESLRLLHQGFHSPDGARQWVIANWFQRVLERYASLEELEGWLDHGCPLHTAQNVRYLIGVKLLRAHRFREALEAFERLTPSALTHSMELVGEWHEIPGAKFEKQLTSSRWLAKKEEELAAAPDPESRALVLHAMARWCFRKPETFRNLLYYEVLLTEEKMAACREGPELEPALSLEDIGLANHFRQAADLFRETLAVCPSYSRREAVEYSIPLCLWRLRKYRWDLFRSRLDGAIYRGFQAFAENHPQSSMADEALYLAGIHHWLSTGRKDTSVIAANMARIAKEFPDGNVARENGRLNPWLKQALAAR